MSYVDHNVQRQSEQEATESRAQRSNANCIYPLYPIAKSTKVIGALALGGDSA